MAQDYKIKDIKKKETWSNAYGEFQSYGLILEGVGEPVSLNKKMPVKYDPKVGDSLYGELEEMTSTNGRPYNKFKSLQKPDAQSNGQDDAYWGERNNSIKAQFAIKTAVDLVKSNEVASEALIQEWAKTFYNMVDKITGDEPIVTNVEGLDPPEQIEEENKRAMFDPEEEINLDDIPF